MKRYDILVNKKQSKVGYIHFMSCRAVLKFIELQNQNKSYLNFKPYMCINL